MHESSFTYPISKPYPFKWFTPVVIIGGIIAVTLLSVLNIASSGYTLVSEYSTDPNSTRKHDDWLAKWPTLGNKIRPICLASAIPINSQLYTNNTALQYTLSTVKLINSTAVSLPSLVYLNNPLVDCRLQSIQMSFERLERTANQIAARSWGLEVHGNTSCRVHGPSGATAITLITEYNFVPKTVSTYEGQYVFPGRNATHAASLWWGESLLSYHYENLTQVFSAAIGDQTKMSLYITRNETVHDVLDQRYFNVWERDTTMYPNPNGTVIDDEASISEDHRGITAYSDPGSAGLPGIIYRIGWIRDEYSSFPYLIANTSGPNIWPIVDSLTKSFESTILTDLGQLDARPNILINTTLLQFYTSTIASLQSGDVGPASADYNSLKGSVGPLLINPSTLSTVYLCQIPRRKPARELVFSVLVADLVFLQAIWLLFTFCVGLWMKRRDPSTNYCSKCAAAAEQNGLPRSYQETRYSKLSNVEVARSNSQDDG